VRELIAEHDVIFLGLDSREARWLPTVISASLGKLVINVALGFDTFVVMRHGLHNYDHSSTSSSSSSSHSGSGSGSTANLSNVEMGCYFCNDVNAPRDSLTDRTLDQQCTVTRPGLSFMASAIAVELFSCLLHHPQKGRAPAEIPQSFMDKTSTILGSVPHQIRGFLSTYANVPMTGHRYTQCVACSEPVIHAYRKDPINFCLSVFNKPSILEDVSGITAMKQQHVNVNEASWTEGIDDDFDDM